MLYKSIKTQCCVHVVLCWRYLARLWLLAWSGADTTLADSGGHRTLSVHNTTPRQHLHNNTKPHGPRHNNHVLLNDHDESQQNFPCLF